MNRKTQKILKSFLFILLIFGIPSMILGIINSPPRTNFSDEDINMGKQFFLEYALNHQHPETGLFIEPDIDSNFRVLDVLNNTLTDISEIPSNLDKFSNETIMNFFINYLFNKQNENGGHSDIAGFANMFSTYEVVNTIDIIDDTWIDQLENQDNVTSINTYLNESVTGEGWGFKINQYSNYSDVISTYNGIKLAQRFSNDIIDNTNMSKFINSTRGIGTYRISNYSLDATPQSTYYGIMAHMELGKSYSGAELTLFQAYFTSLYNNTDKGYSASPLGAADADSTYYVLASMKKLGLPLINEVDIYNFLKTCQKDDNGFGSRPEPPVITPENYTYFPSTFQSGWSSIKAMLLLNESAGPFADLEDIITQYYGWIYDHQAKNGLVGFSSVESNYWGVKTAYTVRDPDIGININTDDILNILNFIDYCYDNNSGGFGSQPSFNSSLYATYCALNIYDMLSSPKTYGPNSTATANFIASLQHNDGGFVIGNDLDNIIELFGDYGEIIKSLVNTNQSTAPSTYWAVESLSILNEVDSINKLNLTKWIKSLQNADGGYSIILGFHSDVVSTYYALSTFLIDEIWAEPMSKMAAIEFLMGAQTEDGGFTAIPLLSSYFSESQTFLLSYVAAKGLYLYNTQPQDIDGLVSYFISSINNDIGGIGDKPGFGSDLRNTPYAVDLMEYLRYNLSFDPEPWNEMLLVVLLIEFIIGTVFVILKILSYIGTTATKRILSRLGIDFSLNVSYLQKFPAINVEDLSIFAGGKCIIDSITVRLEHGEILGVLGESGAGKSTFVKGLLGMRKVEGLSQVYGMNPKKANKLRPLYGYVPQDLSKVYQNFTVMANLNYFGMQYGLSNKEIERKGKRILKSLGILDKANELVKNLSGGQKRRVSIAIALIHTPILCILDEPTSGLDPVIREELWLALTEINENFNTTLIVITHYPEESRFCNKVAIFGRKRGMIDYGHPRELLDRLPGRGRTIQLEFDSVQEDTIGRLEKFEEIDKILEIKSGISFAIYSDSSLMRVKEIISNEFPGCKNITLYQNDSKMEELFRYRAMEVPKIE